MAIIASNKVTRKKGLLYYLKRDHIIYILMIPGLLYYLIFRYLPMLGIVIAFKEYNPYLGLEGIFSAPWVGFKYFTQFINSINFWRLMRNTFMISFWGLVFGFPAPIILALLINEISNKRFKKIVQTVSYLPHFLSIVIVCGILRNILSTDGGLVNLAIKMLGGTPVYFLGEARYFYAIMTASGIWQNIGWNSIIYLAAITNINPELYESAHVDGANTFQKMWHITIPGIYQIISIMLILRVGELLTVGYEKILLLYSPMIYETADVISTYVYREGLIGLKYSYSTAINMFVSVISLVLVLSSNYAAKKIGQEGIW